MSGNEKVRDKMRLGDLTLDQISELAYKWCKSYGNCRECPHIHTNKNKVLCQFVEYFENDLIDLDEEVVNVSNDEFCL